MNFEFLILNLGSFSFPKTGKEKRFLCPVLWMTLVACLLLTAGNKARAQSAAGGGVESPFELGGSARALGMGGAAVAVTGDGDSFFENPAALSTLTTHEILTFHAPLFADTLYDAIGYVNPTGSHEGFGLAAARVGVSDILQTTTNIQAVSTFSSEQLEGLAGYGFQLIDGLDIGASIKYLHEQLGTYQGSGFGIDVGLLYRFASNREQYRRFGVDNFILGFSVSNLLQPQFKLFQTTDEPAQVYRPAVAYLLVPATNSTLWMTVEGEAAQGGTTLVRAGAEYGWNNTIFGRAGFDGVGPTAGVGLRLYDFEFDYAFSQADLGSLNQFSLTYHFGRYVDPREAQKIDLLKWVAKSYAQNNDYDPAIKAWQNVGREFPDDTEVTGAIKALEQKRQNAVGDNLRMAKDAMERDDVNKALPFIAKVLSLDPGNPEAEGLLKNVDKDMIISTNYMRGVEAYSKEDYSSAVQYLKMVNDADPQYRDVQFIYHDAESHYMPLESMSKELTELYAKGVNAYMAGNYNQAIEIWSKVLAKNPKNFLVQRNIEEARTRLREKGLPDEPNSNSSEKK